MTRDQKLTFDEVVKARHEATYDEVATHYAGPMSKHPVISVKGHPEVIWVRPDMGVGAVANSISFATGSPAREIPWREVKRSLKSWIPPHRDQHVGQESASFYPGEFCCVGRGW